MIGWLVRGREGETDREGILRGLSLINEGDLSIRAAVWRLCMNISLQFLNKLLFH